MWLLCGLHSRTGAMRVRACAQNSREAVGMSCNDRTRRLGLQARRQVVSGGDIGNNAEVIIPFAGRIGNDRQGRRGCSGPPSWPRSDRCHDAKGDEGLPNRPAPRTLPRLRIEPNRRAEYLAPGAPTICGNCAQISCFTNVASISVMLVRHPRRETRHESARLAPRNRNPSRATTRCDEMLVGLVL